VAGFIGIVGWVGAVDGHTSPPSVGTQFRIRLTLGNGSGSRPVQDSANRRLPAAIAPGTPIARPETGPGGIYARLADLGRAPARFREDIRSRMPLPAEADRLQIAAGTPIVEICRVALDADGIPVEVNEMTADSSAYVFRYEFDA
jgi:DNA-binding GntR family transcriptional regulator